mgnify:FL=1
MKKHHKHKFIGKSQASEFVGVYMSGMGDNDDIQFVDQLGETILGDSDRDIVGFPLDKLSVTTYWPVKTFTNEVVPEGGRKYAVPLFFRPGNVVQVTNFELGDEFCFSEFLTFIGVWCEGDEITDIKTFWKSIKYDRKGRHFHAASAWAALNYCVTDVQKSSVSPKNILDVGNAGETWLFNISKQFFNTLDVKYYTLEIADSLKHSDSSMSKTVPHDRWFEIIHDAHEIETIDKSLLPDEGFDVINVARGGCDLFKNADFIKTLNDLYSLLTPGGTLIFPVLFFNIFDKPFREQEETVYRSSLGTFKIGDDVPYIPPHDYIEIFKNSNVSLDLTEHFIRWCASNISRFYIKNQPDSSVRAYCNFFEKTHTPLTLRELSFFDLIRARSCDLTVADSLFDCSSRPTLSIRGSFTVTKPNIPDLNVMEED